MKILVLNGSVSKNSVPLVAMHLSQDYDVVTEVIVNEDLAIMKQKYDIWEHVPDSELLGPLNDVVEYSKDLISDIEPTLLVGINFGCAIINTLISEGSWSGSAIMVDPDGVFFLDKETINYNKKCVWFVRKNDKSFVRKNLSKLPLFKLGTTIYVNDEDDMKNLHTMTMIKNVAGSLCS